MGAVSDWCSVTSGVPQGSVLGPIFFVLFVNDINDVVSSPLFQFADDHTILRPILSERDHVALQNDIHNIFQWTLRNKLPLNFLNVLLCTWLGQNLLITVILILWVMVHLLKSMNSSYLVLPSVRIYLLALILMLFLTRFQNCLVSLLGAQEACPLMLCLTSIKPLSCHILERFSRAGPRGRGRERARLGEHPLTWLLSNNRLENVPFVSVLHTSSNRLLLSNQDKGCTPSVAHSLPLPLDPALLNLWTIYCACVWAPHQSKEIIWIG